MSRNLTHKVVAITGAANGIGAQVARDLVAAGARVALLDRDALGAERLAAELGSAAAAFEADVTSAESMGTACAAATRHFGAMDVIPGPLVSAYVSSKAGVESLVRAVRIEVAGDGIGVGIAYFGLIDTGLANAMLDRSGLGVVLPGPLGKLSPIDAAASAITTGIVRRARRVYAPWRIGPMLDLRPLLFLADRLLAVLPSTRRLIRADGAKGVRP